MKDWHQLIPFAALMSQQVPPNRPALTRLSEQVIVGAVSAIGALQVQQARHDSEIAAIQRELARIVIQQDKTRDELMAKIESIRADLYKPSIQVK